VTPGVVDEDRDGAVLGLDRGQHGIGLRRVRDVELHAGPAVARFAQHRAIARRTSSVVAVPITVAPSCASRCAIARPMPRVAPVTSATCPARRAHARAPSSAPAIASLSVSANAGKSSRCAWSSRRAPCPGRIRRRASRRDPPWLARWRSSAPDWRPGAQRFADLVVVAMLRHVDVVDDGNRVCDSNLLERAAQAARPRVATTCCGKGADTGSITPRLGAFWRARPIARSTASRWPAMTSWPGALKFTASTTCPCAASAHAVRLPHRQRP
jgi:hypothetical protein